MYIDRIDLSLPEEEIAALLATFLSAEEQLRVLPAVNPNDRKRYAKLGLKNEGLALQIIEVGRQNPEVIPRGINFEQIDRDITARHQLRVLKLVLERLLSKVQDAMQLTGVDIYAAALSIYHCLRRDAGTSGLREVVEELKRGFARPSRKKKEETAVTLATPAPAPAPQYQPQLAPPAAQAERASDAGPLRGNQVPSQKQGEGSENTLPGRGRRVISSLTAEFPQVVYCEHVLYDPNRVAACFTFPERASTTLNLRDTEAMVRLRHRFLQKTPALD